MSPSSRPGPPQGPPPPPPGPPPNLYFAFGSNLSLAQMARRCPRSRYIGLATLSDYRWHINVRGYANVVPMRGSSVHGLVYEIDRGDEARLDRNEGVAHDCYSKAKLAVKLYPTATALYRRPVEWIVRKGGPSAVLAKTKRESRETATQPLDQVGVLVYIDRKRVNDGEPLEEYIDRMNVGIRDAVALGANRNYFSEVVRPFVPERKGPERPGRGQRRAGELQAARAMGGRDRSSSPSRKGRQAGYQRGDRFVPQTSSRKPRNEDEKERANHGARRGQRVNDRRADTRGTLRAVSVTVFRVAIWFKDRCGS